METLIDRLRAALAGRYAVERELGHGGMATVYLADDLKHHRPVAIKVLKPELAAVLGADRFLREIEIAASLTHPHIVPLFDSGKGAGLLYYVMPYVEGESLRDRLDREKQLPVEDAVLVVQAVASALSYAHGRNVVHRDIKPENILFEAGHAVVSDFGIARAITAAGAERLTETGIAVGTPAYMSPEQTSGEPKVNGRSDIYSLGCVLYEMLAGHPPFMGASAQAVLARHALDPVPPLRSVRPGVTAAIEQAVMKALEKVPADRFATVSQFAEALTRRSVPGEAGTMSRVAPAPAQSIAVLPFVNLSADPQNEYFTDGMTEQIVNALTKAKGLHVAAWTSSMALKGMGHDLRAIGGKLGVRTLLEGSVRWAGDRLRVTAELVNIADGYQLWSETYDRAVQDVFAIQDDIAGTIVQALKGKLGEEERLPITRRYTDNLEVYHLYLKGRYHWNKRPRETLKGLDYFQRAIAKDAHYAPAFAGLADCYTTLGSWEAGAMAPREAFPKAIAAAMRAVEIDSALAEGYAPVAYADTHHYWDWEGAESAFQRAFELNPDYTPAHHWYSHYLLARGRVQDSLAASLRCLEIEPLDDLMNVHLAWHYQFSGDYDRAIEQCKKTLELHPNSFWVPFFLGLAYEQKAMYPEAIAQLQAAVTQSGDHTVMAAALGHAYAAAGKRRQALKVLDQLNALSERRYVSPYERAVIHAGLGKMETAFQWLEHAYQERDGWLVYLNVDPRIAGLRSDPRYAGLLARVGLENRGEHQDATSTRAAH